MAESLSQELFQAIVDIPIIDPHSHIDPFHPVSKTLDDILNYHYYTELAFSTGMDKQILEAGNDGDIPHRRVLAILKQMKRFDNTAQVEWFLDMCRSLFGLTNEDILNDHPETLFNRIGMVLQKSNWEEEIFHKTNLQAIFLTNEFDDPLTGFNSNRYIPCLRTDTLVFRLHEPEVVDRLEKVTGIRSLDRHSLNLALGELFSHFRHHKAKACAISLPPNFAPIEDNDSLHPTGVFWQIAKLAQEFQMPFNLMIGVNRRVFRNGVYQGQDLFDQRTSLIQFSELFNKFPHSSFPISVLTSNQNQELASYSWIFPNILTHGHWWYSNVPAYIKNDLRARLQMVPKTKQIGYYSDAYKLEFVLPKFNMYRRILAELLAEEWVKPKKISETKAIELANQVLVGTTKEIYRL